MKRLIEETACEHGKYHDHFVEGEGCRGSSSRELTADLRLIGLAAMAWLHEHDTEGHASLMDAEIDKDALAVAIDALAGGL